MGRKRERVGEGEGERERGKRGEREGQDGKEGERERAQCLQVFVFTLFSL